MKMTLVSLLQGRRNKRGMALISVLAVLFLATLLVVAFLARTTGARAAASNFNATAQTRVLADTAVNFVMAQINEATMYGLSPTGAPTTAGTYYTWASQPGAIRVFGQPSSSNTSGLTTIMRLYSATPATASTARTTTTLADLANDLPNGGSWTTGNWSTYGAQWVDLNAFVKDAEGKYHFPIVDPRDPQADPTVNPTSTTLGTLWQPKGSNLPLAGFYINQPAAMVPSTPVNTAAMPVRWLYILKDGAMISPDAPATPANVLAFTKAVNAVGAADTPTVKNPIVGRIAFWTDDDTSKININVAAGDDVVRGAGGSTQYPADSIFWDTPYFSGPDEANLAIYQPAAGEIQRYPGSPATTGLNTTLSTLMGLTTPMPYDDFLGAFTASFDPNTGVPSSITVTKESLLPRYIGGGTESATMAIPYTGNGANENILPSNRLYNSVAEMLFKATPSGATARTKSAMVSSGDMTTSEADAVAAVERSEFFLTAHSSAPELNLFGEPRVSIWPYTTSPTAGATGYQTPEDNLLSFDSSFRNGSSIQNFYFQRRDPTSSVTDCNLASNVSLFYYLDTLTGLKIPGFGQALSAKYSNSAVPPKMRQILAEIFDYVRTTNMLDPVIAAGQGNGGGISKTYGQNWGLNTANPIFVYPSTGYRSAAGGVQVVPSANKGGGLNGWRVQGLGAFPIPVELTFHFVAMGTGYVPKVGTTFPAQPENPIPSQQYAAPNIAHDTRASSYDLIQDENSLTASDDFLAQVLGGDMTVPKSDPPAKPRTSLATAALWDPPQGQPANWSTAMECFVYVSFINPGVIESHDQPMFCFSLTGLNGLTVTDGASGTVIPLHFPGNSNANTNGSATDEEVCLVDNSDGGGFINGWIGDWIFGYIPWLGEVGDNNYGGNPGMCAPNQISGATWNIANTIKIAPAATIYNYLGSNGKRQNPPTDSPPLQAVTGRNFPFYSQLFGLSGIQGEPSGNGNPNANANFSINGATIVLKMYDANRDGQAISGTNVVNTISVVVPTGTFPMPIYSPNNATDSHIIGTLGNDTSVAIRPPGSPGGDDPDSSALINSNDRWHQSADAASGIGDYENRITPDDTVKSVTLSPLWSDARDLALNNAAAVNIFSVHPNWSLNTTNSTAGYPSQAHDLLQDSAAPIIGNLWSYNWGRLVTQVVSKTSPSTSDTYAPATGQTQTASVTFNYPIVPPLLNGPTNSATPAAGAGAYTASHTPGDWDTGIAYYPDGPWINMADEGAQTTNVQQDDATGGAFDQGASYAYFNTGNLAQKTGMSANFSPNREMPSPVMFGSLPTGVSTTSPQPWQTLLFHPGPYFGNYSSGLYHAVGEPNMSSAGTTGGVYTANSFFPADHLLLDLFWMPQAEPYPISQTFVTEGKINMNYEIQPFTYITRDVALRAVLSSVKVAVMPDTAPAGQNGYNYKNPGNPFSITAGQIAGLTSGHDPNGNSRLPVDPDQTLGLNPRSLGDPHQPALGASTLTTGQTSLSATQNAAWYDYKAATTRFFKSPSEICEMFLVPQGYSWSQFSGYSGLTAASWYKVPGGNFALVGDNMREKPYADIYSRLTTKSNTYTVYYTVQSLKNAEPPVNSTGLTPGQQIWDESKGNVVGEYRGSTMIERFLDPNESLPQYVNSTSGSQGSAAGNISLEAYYKWRVISTRQFAP